MSLFGSMRTSVSGMAAQSNRLATVADNIANASTTGYKKASVEFETLMGHNLVNNYVSGGVESHTRYGITEQGVLSKTTSVTDLAIQGNGFFVVTDGGGANFLTRAGSFVPDASGHLVNTAGYTLMGYDLAAGDPGALGGLGTLSKIDVNGRALTAVASSSGEFIANLSSEDTIVDPAELPSLNVAGSSYSAKSSLIAFDNLGAEVKLALYFAKTADNTWEVSVYDNADAGPSGGFPYANPPIVTDTLTFDGTNGKLTTPASLSIAIPNGNTVDLDVSKMTQLASGYTIINADVNGNAPSQLDHIEVGASGIISAVYQNGTKVDTYRIPLGKVASPDNLIPLDGGIYDAGTASGDIILGAANGDGMGRIVSNALEGSTVDLATELTTMIEAQRAYAANSKVLQTSADLLEVLNSVK